jgi:ubiquinone/menaquinone biosynthesis C-methylase UbiE
MSISLRRFYEREGERVQRYSNTSFWEARYHNKRKAYTINLLKSDEQFESLLDIGCGTGEYLKYAIDLDYSKIVIGVDISSSYLNRINSKSKKLHLILADARFLPFRAQCVNTVLCAATLEHVPNWVRVLKELYRVARNRIVIEVPNAGVVRWIARKLLPTLVKRLDADVGHLHILPQHIWQLKVMEVTGTLSHIDTVHILPPIFGRVFHLPSQFEKLVTCAESLANKILPLEGNITHLVLEFNSA